MDEMTLFERKYADNPLAIHLARAERNAKEALNLCYAADNTRRSIWYRMALGRAQSILISLLVRELGREKPEQKFITLPTEPAKPITEKDAAAGQEEERGC